MQTDSIAELRDAVSRATRTLRDGEPSGPRPSLDRPPKPELGDYSSNAAMLLAAPLGENPRDVAGRLGAELERELGGESGSVERIEVAGPGFVNLFLADAWYRRAMERLAASGESLGPAPTESPGTDPGRVRLRQPDRARCTSAAAATPPTATPSCGCSRRSATRSSASSTSTTAAARSSASRSRSPPG